MKNPLLLLPITAALLASGCASGPPAIDTLQPNAISVATSRGQYELNCPAATGSLISREEIQPISFQFGVVRAEYTVGVSGCNKQVSYIVICPENGSGGCIATGGNGIVQ